ncbi:MAG: preprotein translocase subunit SecG [Alphaproteobacteria bacterium]|nr:preprotein translocase subunit SecG [Alphaproteobacteria bacterium]MCL2505145.1 preprotein translocase subunit SecG [Alphaproteobacteria bacterium]
MLNVLLVLQLILAVALVIVVLVQRTSQDGGGLVGGGGSTMGGLFTAKGSANILTRVTAVLATVFILNSLALGILAGRSGQPSSLADKIAASIDIEGVAPVSESIDSVSKYLGTEDNDLPEEESVEQIDAKDTKETTVPEVPVAQ